MKNLGGVSLMCIVLYYLGIGGQDAGRTVGASQPDEVTSLGLGVEPVFFRQKATVHTLSLIHISEPTRPY